MKPKLVIVELASPDLAVAKWWVSDNRKTCKMEIHRHLNLPLEKGGIREEIVTWSPEFGDLFAVATRMGIPFRTDYIEGRSVSEIITELHDGAERKTL